MRRLDFFGLIVALFLLVFVSISALPAEDEERKKYEQYLDALKLVEMEAHLMLAIASVDDTTLVGVGCYNSNIPPQTPLVFGNLDKTQLTGGGLYRAHSGGGNKLYGVVAIGSLYKADGSFHDRLQSPDIMAVHISSEANYFLVKIRCHTGEAKPFFDLSQKK